jgi:predicted RNA-binding protein with RPS1 domain
VNSMAELPPVNSIQQGSVCRIESYGAFIQFKSFPYRGLCHISQLHESRVENVSDIVQLDQPVWVRVLEITTDNDDGRPKIRLGIKGVAQDTGEAQARAEEMSNQIQTNLQSTIGMGVATDPMLGLRLKGHSGNTLLINGYALVDDTEGELPIPATNITRQNEPTATVQPMGRGRGTTLPAWMTQQQDVNQLGKELEKERNHRYEKKKSKKDDRREKKHKKSKHPDDRKRHRRRRSFSDEEESYTDSEGEARRENKRHRRRRNRSFSASSSCDSQRRRHRERRHRSSRKSNGTGNDDSFEKVKDATATLDEEGVR